MSINYLPRGSLPLTSSFNKNFTYIYPQNRNGINNNSILINSIESNQNRTLANISHSLNNHNLPKNYNKDRYRIVKINNLKTNKGIRVIELKGKDIKSSGTLIASSSSRDFNGILKNGKKIKNIDINEESQDNDNKDSENASPNKIIKNSQLANKVSILDSNAKNTLLKSNTIPTTTASLNPFAKFLNKILDKIDPKINKKNYEYLQYEEGLYKNRSLEPLNYNNITIQKNNENIIQNNQLKNNLNQKSYNKPKFNDKSPDNSTKNNSNSNSFPNDSSKNINQSPINLKNASTLSSNKSTQKSLNNNNLEKKLNNNQINNSKENKVISEKEADKKSDSKTSSSKFPFQSLDGIVNSPKSKKSNNININSNLNLGTIDGSFDNIVTNLDEHIKKEIEPKPMTIEDIINKKKGQGFKYCSELSQAGRDSEGKIKTNQDTSLVSLSIGGIIGFNLFGVLDGHGPNGHFVSQYCKEYFIKKMTNYVELLKQSIGIVSSEGIYNELKATNFAYICDLFTQADSELLLKNMFDCTISGTTCNLVFQFNKHLVCFSVGDSRGILVYDYGFNILGGILPLSTDHKPDLPGEIDRIMSLGGYVDHMKDIYGNRIGPPRVYKLGYNYPGLAMSRSLGDFQAKEVGVISNPQIIEYDINASTRYLVICSDGVWEFSSNEQVRDIANMFYKKNDVAGFCHELIKFAISLWGQLDVVRDDITVVAVFF